MKKRIIKRKSSDEGLLISNKDVILSIFNKPQTEVQLEASICFARYLSIIGMNRRNYKLFLKVMESNNSWVIDALVSDRDAKLLFSTVKPNKFLVRSAFKVLTFWHPKEIYKKLLEAMLGIIQTAYYNADDGYKIYQLTIADLDNLGKFLDLKKDQFDEINEMILEVLDKIAKLGFYNWSNQKSIISKHAFDIRFGYFDKSKKIHDVIPHVLLVAIDREKSELKPSKEFIRFLNRDKV